MKFIILTTNCSAENTRKKYYSKQVFHIANDAEASMGIQIIMCMLMPYAVPPFFVCFSCWMR